MIFPIPSFRRKGKEPGSTGSQTPAQFCSPKIEKKGAAQSPRRLWCGSNKCSPNHAKKEKSSLQLGLTVVLTEADIFRCTLLGDNF